jgi:transposase
VPAPSLYYQYNLVGSDKKQDWQLIWACKFDGFDQAERFDEILLLCTNFPLERLSTGEGMKKYNNQVSIEQIFDFIKNPVHIRPLWLLSPQQLAGLTLLIMPDVLIATLIEEYVRQEIAKNKKLLKVFMQKIRYNPYPTEECRLTA